MNILEFFNGDNLAESKEIIELNNVFSSSSALPPTTGKLKTWAMLCYGQVHEQ